jgi:Secretion system C-terminal sorting domain
LVVIDTINNHHNIWQIGKPNKTTFTSAFSAPNAIVTDTLHPYPVNDTSVFILKVPTKAPTCFSSDTIPSAPLLYFRFEYYLDIDSMATARVEVSKDRGSHWVNVRDSFPPGYSWDGIPADLTHSTLGWNYYGLHLPSFGGIFTGGYDTLLFRFTFISDSAYSGKDGWMIDNFEFYYWCEGSVPRVPNNNLISIYPNPSQGNIYIHSNNQNASGGSVSVFDMKGREDGKTKQLPANGYLNLPLPDGVYTLKYFEGDEYCVKRIVINQ